MKKLNQHYNKSNQQVHRIKQVWETNHTIIEKKSNQHAKKIEQLCKKNQTNMPNKCAKTTKHAKNPNMCKNNPYMHKNN